MCVGRKEYLRTFWFFHLNDLVFLLSAAFLSLFVFVFKEKGASLLYLACPSFLIFLFGARHISIYLLEEAAHC